MTEYIVEAYLPRRDAARRAEVVARARAAAEAMALEGVAIRYLRSIFVSEDETCFHLFEGPSAEAVAEASRRAALSYERISEAAELGRGAEL